MTIGAAQQPSSECGCPAGGWLNQSTVGCPTSSAQGPEPKCYEPPKTRKQHVRQTNQNRILKTLLLKPCCKKPRRCQLPYNKSWLLSRTPEWGQEIGTKTGRAARGLPSSQECHVGCSNQRDGQAKGRHAQPTMPMKPQRLAGRERFWKARRHRKHHPRWTPFWTGPSEEKIVTRPPFWGPNFGPQNEGRQMSLFATTSHSALVQTCPSTLLKRLRMTLCGPAFLK